MIPYTIIKEVNPDEVKGSATGAINFFSCVHQVRVNMTAIEQTPEVRAVRERPQIGDPPSR